MNSKRLSIIIPSLNPGEKLRECLKSVFSFDHSLFYVILQDGMSRDSSVSQAERAYPQLIIYCENDHGVYDAMNRALDKVRTEYVYFLGSDDYLLPEFGNILECIKKTNKDLIYANVFLSKSKKEFDGFYDYNKLSQYNFSHQAAIYRKSVLDELGCFDCRYNIFADYALNLAIFGAKRYSTQYVDLCIASFSEEGISSTGNTSIVDPIFSYDKPSLIESGELFNPNIQGYHHALLKRAEVQFSRQEFFGAFLTILKRARVQNEIGANMRFYFGSIKQSLFKG